MKLAYVAFDKAGRQVADSIEAGDASEATEALRRKGLYVTSIAPGGSDRLSAATPRGRRRRPRRLKHLAMMMRQLQVLVSCGTPLVQALYALERQTTDASWRQIIIDVRGRVEQGTTLAAAMESHPECFGPLCLSLIAAGESSGKLPDMLDRLAVTMRKQVRIRNVLVSAMLYPSLLVGVAMTVLLVLLMLVVPRFGELFESLDVPLPPTTSLLVSVGETFRAYWFVVFPVPVALIVGVALWLTTPGGKRVFDTTVLWLPQVGRIVRSFATARIVRLLGVLLESDVDVLEALNLARQSVTNHHYSALLAGAQDAVTRGEPISTAFADGKLISPSVYEAVRSGEESGQVGPMMLNVSDFLDEENEVIVRSLTSIIEPVILIAMGILVGLVAVSMFLPLFDLTSMTQGGGS
jgi:type IV pilus assembly protein PilC